MNKPIYKSRKFWTAILTAVCTAISYSKAGPELAAMISAIGMTLIGGLGMEDWGKSSHVALED
jgi:hypothetical protein